MRPFQSTGLEQAIRAVNGYLSELVRAAFSGIYVRSHEHDDAVAEIAGLCRANSWTLATWDVDRGLALAGHAADAPGALPGAADPLAAIRALGALATPEGTALLVLRNFHRFLGSPEVVQALDTRVVAGRRDRTYVVILAPAVKLPPELEKLFVVVDHDLPGRAQLEAIARGVATEPGELPDGDGLAAVLDAAAGLTRMEAENAFSLALVRHSRLAPEVLWELKGQTLKKSGLLTLHQGGETFADLGGLDSLKAFCARALRPGRRPRPGRPPAGPARLRQERPVQGPGQRDGPPHAGPGRRGADGLARGLHRGQRPPGPGADRRDGPLRRHDRRGREGAGRRRRRPGRLGRRGSSGRP